MMGALLRNDASDVVQRSFGWLAVVAVMDRDGLRGVVAGRKEDEREAALTRSQEREDGKKNSFSVAEQCSHLRMLRSAQGWRHGFPHNTF